MKTNRFVLCVFAVAGLACDSTGGNVSGGNGGTTLADSRATAGSTAGTTESTAANTPAASPDSGRLIVPPAPRSDAGVTSAMAEPLPPFACTADAFYMCEGNYNCDEGMIAAWQCNSTGDDAVWIIGSDGESCECRSFGDVPDAAIPTLPPPAKSDAAVTPPSLTRDAGVADSATKDALKVDARTPDLAPDMLAQTPDATPMVPDLALPDTSIPIDLAPPATPDASVPIVEEPGPCTTPDASVISPDTAPAPQPDASEPDTKLRHDCGCREPDTAPITPPDTMPDTMPADTFVPAPQPDAEPDSQTPDTMPANAPDSMPLQPDAGCTITLSLTAPATTDTQLHCYSKSVYWTATGCSPTGFKVVWSRTTGPGCELRTSDAGATYDDSSADVDSTVRSRVMYDTKGPGNYDVVVCQMSGDICGPCSNTVSLPLSY